MDKAPEMPKFGHFTGKAQDLAAFDKANSKAAFLGCLAVEHYERLPLLCNFFTANITKSACYYEVTGTFWS